MMTIRSLVQGSLDIYIANCIQERKEKGKENKTHAHGINPSTVVNSTRMGKHLCGWDICLPPPEIFLSSSSFCFSMSQSFDLKNLHVVCDTVAKFALSNRENRMERGDRKRVKKKIVFKKLVLI
jgi:hypothetical protein